MRGATKVMFAHDDGVMLLLHLARFGCVCGERLRLTGFACSCLPVCLTHRHTHIHTYRHTHTQTHTHRHTHTDTPSTLALVQATYRFLRSLPAHSDINIVPRGHINVKGKGRVKAFLVLGCTSMPGELLLPDAEESGDMGKEVGMLRMQCQMQQAMHGSAHSSSSRDGSISPQMRYSTSGFNSTPTSSLHLNRAGLSAFELKNYM